VTIGVVIAAAGAGTRLGAGRPKALLPLGGEPLLRHSLRALLGHPLIGPIAAAVPDPAEVSAALGEMDRRVRLVRGGRTRQESVRAALESLPETDLVLVHDAARPFVDRGLVDAVIEAALRHGAAVPVVPVADTLKRLAPGGVVERTLERGDLVLAQTPQGFRGDLLRRAHAAAARAGEEGTDDAVLVERLGEPVAVVEGFATNLKITSRDDLALAEAILRSRREGARHG
jgi:2-C-methyl-D-erythritol 4-phosphate cytidylyltransferase